MVFKSDPDSPLTYGLGVLTLGGGGVNFPGDPGKQGRVHAAEGLTRKSPNEPQAA